MKACTVQDLSIIGSASSRPSQVGKAHGILMKGNADGANNFENKWFPTIDNCYISGFSGGGITCNNTGYGLTHGLNVTNCKIYNCGAGVNIDYFSEYNRFTNVAVYGSLYGCINNGGNNMFVNCMFSGCTTGFLIQRSTNDSHGSAIGCTFNHSGGDAGTAIQIVGARCGYIFQGCQIFYGKIDIQNSDGIVFDGLNIGQKQKIYISGGGMVTFNNCGFSTIPEIYVTNNNNVKFNECYTWKGAAVVYSGI